MKGNEDKGRKLISGFNCCFSGWVVPFSVSVRPFFLITFGIRLLVLLIFFVKYGELEMVEGNGAETNFNLVTKNCF